MNVRRLKAWPTCGGKQFFVTTAKAPCRSGRRAVIRKENTDLSLTRRCKLVKISRSSLYDTPVGFDQATIELMHKIDRIFSKYLFFGSRQIAAHLPQSGFAAGRHRMRRLMGIMGLQAIDTGPNTSKKHPQHKIWPYLLRKLAITRTNQVWCSDIPHRIFKSPARFAGA